MPVNFLEIRTQVREMGCGAPLRLQRLSDLRTQAGQVLAAYARNPGFLSQRAEQARQNNNHLRCALPAQEELDATFAPPPEMPEHVLLAADGSQIDPSRHDRVEFGVINAGAIRMLPGQAEAPRLVTHSRLLFDEDLFTADGSPIGEEMVALRRDLAERTLLAEEAARETLPVVALTDGPLELFRDPRDRAEMQAQFDDYLKTLRSLAGLRAVAAGYVDKPGSDLVVRLLELALEPEDKLGRERPLRGLRDSFIFRELLAPGQRSAVFAIQSTMAQRFSGELGLHFFYLNVGRAGAPALARVEIPAWVAGDEKLLALLHVVLVDQCRKMGSHPYPYALHRAHEVAVVPLQERRQLEDLISAEFRSQGLAVDERSNKDFAKALPGKSRGLKR